ncbi:hypothetical protein IKS57_00675 [bacterium]|nr:hypothetical protein [bacterium]
MEDVAIKIPISNKLLIIDKTASAGTAHIAILEMFCSESRDSLTIGASSKSKS